MNFDVMCFDWVGESLRVVHHEYFETYSQAREFQLGEGAKYESTSVTPMNEAAELILRLS